MELLQFQLLLYSALEELSPEYDAPAALSRKPPPPLYIVYGAGVGVGVRLESLEKGNDFNTY